MTTPILLTTVHDPEGKLFEVAQQALPALTELYDGKMVAEITNNTDIRLHHLLANYAHVHCNPPGDIAHARRQLVRNGLKLYPSAYFHFVDFDRLLHWQTHYSDELRLAVAALPNFHFIVLGRTKRAMRTHPFIQRETERLINRLFALVFRQSQALGGPPWGIDVLAASRGISNNTARIIATNSRAIGPAGVDVEWPIIASWLGKVSYIATEGLEYESDTFDIRRPMIAEWQVRWRNVWQAARAIARLLYAEDYRRGNVPGERPRPATGK